MNEYELLGGLHNIIDNDTDEKLRQWIDAHNVNNYLLYPLAAIELAAIKEAPENIENLFRRCIATFVFSKAKEFGKEIYLKKFNTSGFRKFIQSYEMELVPIYQNYRFSREINDINPFSKPRLVPQGENRYILTTSLVSDKYMEEQFYFEGVDEPENAEKERNQVMDLHLMFWNKVVLEQKNIEDLQNNIDVTLYLECVKIIQKDLNKWDSNVKSIIFDNSLQLAKVIAFFYYHAMVKSICIHIDMQYEDDFINVGKDCIIVLEKKLCIRHIVDVSGIPEQKVSTIVNYLINDGKMNLLEFPLFELEDKIVTIPSAIMVNDWQFTIVNGLYMKNILIKNREKTISTVTEGRIEKVLYGVENIAVAKTIQYSFNDGNGESQCSDIDYAIYDMTRNILLIIEAKWIDKHYKDEIDKRYGMILHTLNDIYTKQIKKHKIYLASKDNIDSLFEGDDRYNKDLQRPQIFYLAVDKRNQIHINDRHMVSEYMLIYFLRKYINNGQLDLEKMWNEIGNLKSTVEYLAISDTYYEISVNDDIVLVEEADLYWNK